MTKPRTPAIFLVLSDEYSTQGGEYEPPEYNRESVVVVAHSKARAKVLGVRWLRRNKSRSLIYGENPFYGLEVIRLPPCACGRTLFGNNHLDSCPDVQREWEAEREAALSFDSIRP